MSPLFASALLALQVASPASEADEKAMLAAELASVSLLATIGPMQTAAEVEQIISDNPQLTPEEQERLRAIGQERADELGRSALAAEASALAQNLSLEDLRAIAAYERSEAAKARRQAAPMVIGAVVATLGEVDYKGDVRAAFCAEAGKLCEE